MSSLDTSASHSVSSSVNNTSIRPLLSASRARIYLRDGVSSGGYRRNSSLPFAVSRSEDVGEPCGATEMRRTGANYVRTIYTKKMAITGRLRLCGRSVGGCSFGPFSARPAFLRSRSRPKPRNRTLFLFSPLSLVPCIFSSSLKSQSSHKREKEK